MTSPPPSVPPQSADAPAGGPGGGPGVEEGTAPVVGPRRGVERPVAGGAPPPRRRWLRRLLPIGVFAALAGVGAWVAHDPDTALDRVSTASHWLAGLGDLEWRDGAGEWHEVASADTRRRQWGPTDAFLSPTWEAAAAGLDLATLTLRRSPNPHQVDLVLARIDPAAWRFRVLMGDEDRPVDAYARDARLALAVNASYFSEEGPIGLVVSDGKRVNRQVAHRAAHFLVDAPGRLPRIVNQRRAKVGPVDQGFQGFPAIMSGGNVYSYLRVGGRGFDVWAVDRRTAACITRDRRVLLLVTDTITNGLTFDELSTVLGGLGCVDAMGFDGGSSTALYVDTATAHQEVAGLRPVRVVLGIEPR